VTERSTYSLLEWLGDIGGLFDALHIIGGFIVGPVAGFSLKAQLLHSVFRHVASLRTSEPQVKDLEENERVERDLTWDFANLKIIPKRDFFRTHG